MSICVTHVHSFCIILKLWCSEISISANCSPGKPWWRHEMETFSALLAICAGNSPVPGKSATQRPVTRSFDVFFDLRLNKRLSKQSSGWWIETPSRPVWRHRNAGSLCISTLRHTLWSGLVSNIEVFLDYQIVCNIRLILFSFLLQNDVTLSGWSITPTKNVTPRLADAWVNVPLKIKRRHRFSITLVLATVEPERHLIWVNLYHTCVSY